MQKEQKSSKKEQKQEKKQAKKATKPGQLITFSLKSQWTLKAITDWKEKIVQLRNAIFKKRQDYKYGSLDKLLISYRIDIDFDNNNESIMVIDWKSKNKLNNTRYLIVTLDIISLYPFTHVQVKQKKGTKIEYIPQKLKSIDHQYISSTLTNKVVTSLQTWYNYNNWEGDPLNLSEVCGKLIAQQVRFNTFEIFQTYCKKQNIEFYDVRSLIKTINNLLNGKYLVWEDESLARGKQILNSPAYKLLLEQMIAKSQGLGPQTKIPKAYEMLIEPLLQQLFKQAKSVPKPLGKISKKVYISQNKTKDIQFVLAMNVIYLQEFVKIIEFETFGNRFKNDKK